MIGTITISIAWTIINLILVYKKKNIIPTTQDSKCVMIFIMGVDLYLWLGGGGGGVIGAKIISAIDQSNQDV